MNFNNIRGKWGNIKRKFEKHVVSSLASSAMLQFCNYWRYIFVLFTLLLHYFKGFTNIFFYQK